MGVIQQSFNQAMSVAGLSNQLRQQNPNYQKKQEDRDFDKSTKKYEEAKKELGKAFENFPEGHPARKALVSAGNQLEDEFNDRLLARGKYTEWAARVGNKLKRQEYDEQKAQEANQRAEDTARQIAEQNQRNRDIVRQLRGLLPLSQELVARHNERRGLNESK